MGDEWGHFINIENNKSITPPETKHFIHYKDEDDEYNFNKYNYGNGDYGNSDYENGDYENGDYENGDYNYNSYNPPNRETKNDNYNKNKRLFIIAYMLFSICNFGTYIVNSCRSFASFVSFGK